MAYVIIVEFQAKPDRSQRSPSRSIAMPEIRAPARTGCLAFDVCHDPDDPARFVFYRASRDEAAHRQHLEMDSYRWFRSEAPNLIVPGSESALPHHRQALTRRPYLSE